MFVITHDCNKNVTCVKFLFVACLFFEQKGCVPDVIAVVARRYYHQTLNHWRSILKNIKKVEKN